MLRGIAAADTGGAGSEKARGQRQPGPCAAVRGVLGTVRFAEHSCCAIPAGSGNWTVVVRGEEFLKSYLKMMNLAAGWKEFLHEHPAGCVLVPKDSALANLLLETPAWKPIYKDDVAVAFVGGRTASK